MKLEQFKQNRTFVDLTPFPIPDRELCDRYAAVFTAAVNDALRERNLVYQTLPHAILPLRDGMKTAGIAFTVKGAPNLEIKDEMAQRVEMLEAIPANSVVAWDTSGDSESAQWGEVMTMAALKRGCRGAVVDGGVRDTDRVLEQGLPVFARYRSSNGMLGRFRISGWQVPVRIGQVEIKPGDIVFGDIDGVIVVPRGLAFDILVRAEEIRDSETEIKKWVKEGLSEREITARGGYF